MKVIKAIYNFIVGDMIILVGVGIAIIIVALSAQIKALAFLQPIMGAVLIVAVLAVLTATLLREALGKR